MAFSVMSLIPQPSALHRGETSSPCRLYLDFPQDDSVICRNKWARFDRLPALVLAWHKECQV
jgi:hypothetical protein